MSLTRRGFLGGVGPLTLTALLPGCGGSDETHILAGPAAGAPGGATPVTGTAPWPAPPQPVSTFRHAVASGDPLSDAVILWTRTTPADAMLGSIDVEWRVATDPAMRDIVSDGRISTDASSDYTLHVDVSGLEPDTTYYYRFRALGETSVQGRTKTLPVGSVERMRIGFTSCANYPAGFFNAYALLAAADLDVVLCLGDYIYEYANLSFGDGTSIDRVPAPDREITSLADYRLRHAQYKTDPDLQELHRQHPCIAVWDDHEVANDAYRTGAQNHQAAEGDYPLRKASAEQAYREWMPIRPFAQPERVYRSFACGDLLDLVMLDTRLVGRDAQVDRCDPGAIEAAGRSLLGSDQEAWLSAQLTGSQARGARWRLIGQQVMLAPRVRSASGCVGSADSWDGYGASRRRLLEAISSGRIDNVVVLTGDAHSSWASDVPPDPFDPALYDPITGRGSLLVEFVTPGVSSPGANEAVSAILATHPHVRFTDQTRQGYVVLDVTPERTQAEWYFVPLRERLARAELGAVMQTFAGDAHVIPGGDITLARVGRAALASAD